MDELIQNQAPIIDEEKRAKLMDMANNVLQQQPTTSPDENLAELRALLADEQKSNRIREMANIGSSMAEQIGGLQQGNRLSLDDTAKNKLTQALQKRSQGLNPSTAANILMATQRNEAIASSQKENRDIRKKKDLANKVNTLSKTSRGLNKSIAKADVLMGLLDKVEDKGDIPGIGQGQSAVRAIPLIGDEIANAFTSEKGKQIQGAFQDMVNETVKEYAGSAATAGEVSRIMAALNKSASADEADYLNALDRVFNLYQEDAEFIMNSAAPEVREKFLANGGTDFLSSMQGIRTRLNEFVQAKKANKQEKDPSNNEEWEDENFYFKRENGEVKRKRK